jgi:hypothetical protein
MFFSLIKDPPQVINEYATRYVKNINENVTLVCETYPKCDDGNNYYDWYRFNVRIPVETKQILNYFPNLTTTKDTVTFKCVAHGNNNELTTSTLFTIKIAEGGK